MVTMTLNTISRRTWLLRLGAGGILPWTAIPSSHADGQTTELIGNGAGRSISTAQLNNMLRPFFPQTYPVPGFLDLTLRRPRLLMRPDRNRIDAEFDINAQGPALHRSQNGHFGLGFALRYETSDQTVRAYQLSFNDLVFPGIGQDAVKLIQVYGPALSEVALQNVVVHRFQNKDLAILNALGLRPGGITVTTEGLRIGFEPKPL